MSGTGRALGVVLEPDTWTTILALEMGSVNVITWAIHNTGDNPIADGRLEVGMVAVDAPDSDWFDHPDAAANMPNIPVGGWHTGTSVSHAFQFYRVRLRSVSRTTVDVYMGTR